MSVYIYATLLFFYFASRKAARKDLPTLERPDVNEYFQQFQRQIAFGAEHEEPHPGWTRRLSKFINRRIVGL